MSQQPSAVINMPGFAQLGGQQGPAWRRAPIYPTAPFFSTDPNVSFQPRLYVLNVLPSDYTLGQTLTRSLRFDTPGTIVEINGAAFNTGSGNAFPLGVSGNDTYTVLFEGVTGDKFTTLAALASAVVGNGQNPGEIGAYGYVVNAGGNFNVTIEPLLANLRISLSFKVIETRAGTNYTMGAQTGTIR